MCLLTFGKCRHGSTCMLAAYKAVFILIQFLTSMFYSFISADGFAWIHLEVVRLKQRCQTVQTKEYHFPDMMKTQHQISERFSIMLTFKNLNKKIQPFKFPIDLGAVLLGLWVFGV